MRDNKKELKYIKKKGFKVGDLVVVNFIPNQEFTIISIQNLDTPIGMLSGTIIFKKMIFITVENDIKKFDVTAYEIEHSKSQLRDQKLKKLGI